MDVFDATIYCPSGVHSGEAYRFLSPLVRARALEPSASHSQTFSEPERSERKTMVFPSGEYRGCESNAGPDVIGFASPPDTGSVYRSPSNSKTIVRPSGETSSDIHVPSEVVKSMARVGLSGSSSAFFLEVSGLAAAAGCCANRDTNGMAAARSAAINGLRITGLRVGATARWERGLNLRRPCSTVKRRGGAATAGS